jgi:hypothetical protein
MDAVIMHETISHHRNYAIQFEAQLRPQVMVLGNGQEGYLDSRINYILSISNRTEKKNEFNKKNRG